MRQLLKKIQIKYWILQEKLKKSLNLIKLKLLNLLWKIIYSNNIADIYETNLMRRLAGLLYIDNKDNGLT